MLPSITGTSTCFRPLAGCSLCFSRNPIQYNPIVFVPSRGALHVSIWDQWINLIGKKCSSPCGVFIMSPKIYRKEVKKHFPSPCGVYVEPADTSDSCNGQSASVPLRGWVCQDMGKRVYICRWFPSPCGVCDVSEINDYNYRTQQMPSPYGG